MKIRARSFNQDEQDIKDALQLAELFTEVQRGKWIVFEHISGSLHVRRTFGKSGKLYWFKTFEYRNMETILHECLNNYHSWNINVREL